MMNKLVTGAAVLLVVVALVAGVGFYQNRAPMAADALKGSVTSDFTLTDQDGKTVTNKDFEGKWLLVFFGFTHCPEICPVTMAKVTAVMDGLGARADDVQPLFITVDPARDTVPVIKAYLADYDPRIVGLTGTDEQVKAVAANFKAYYAKVVPAHAAAGHGAHAGHDHHDHGDGDVDSDGGQGHDAHADHAVADDVYMVDHSTYLYLFDKKGSFETFFRYEETADAILGGLQKYLGQ